MAIMSNAGFKSLAICLSTNIIHTIISPLPFIYPTYCRIYLFKVFLFIGGLL